MKNKKIRRCILAIWLIIVVVLLVLIYRYNGNEKAEQIVSKLVWIYVFASCIMTGIMYKLRKKNKDYYCSQ